MIKVSELIEYANMVCIETFGKQFDGEIVWSHRMKKIAGNCRSDGRIALNYQYYEKYGKEEILKVLRHELVHHHCFSEIGRHTHSDPLFVNYLNKLGGDQKGKPMPTTGYVYSCPCCSRQWTLRKKIRNKKISCSTCGNGSYNKEYKVVLVKEVVIEPRESQLIS